MVRDRETVEKSDLDIYAVAEAEIADRLAEEWE